MSTPNRKRNLLDFKQKREIIDYAMKHPIKSIQQQIQLLIIQQLTVIRVYKNFNLSQLLVNLPVKITNTCKIIDV
jgi:hypothetical protein